MSVHMITAAHTAGFVFLRFWTPRPCFLPCLARRKASVPQDPRLLAEEVDDRGKKVGIVGGP